MNHQASEHGEEEKSQAMSSMSPLPRREVATLQPDSHGGPDYAELAALGIGPEDVLDFSASTNAFGPPPEVALAMAHCDLSRYPDRHAEPLRERARRITKACRQSTSCRRTARPS